jgi:hypothetical protein
MLLGLSEARNRRASKRDPTVPRFSFFRASYVHRRSGAIVCTMRRVAHHSPPNHLEKIGGEIEKALSFSKRLAFQLLDAAIYFVGLWSLAKILFK